MTAIAEPASQPMLALQSANVIRVRRAELKAAILSGEETVAGILADTPPYATGMRIAALLGAQYRWGPTRVTHLLARMQVADGKRLSGLTPRQRELIAAATDPNSPASAAPRRVATVVLSSKGLLHLVPRDSHLTACGSGLGSRWRDMPRETWAADSRRCRICERSAGLDVS